MYLALAAVIVCVLVMGITSMGGPERIVRMVKQNVGDREVEKSSTSHKIKMIEGEDEEKAYQEIGDVFNTDIVKIFVCLPGMSFDSVEFYEDKQMAELFYLYNKKTIVYCINAPYREESWGIDFEDTVEEEHFENINGCRVKVTKYKIDKEDLPKWVAKFEYNNIEYMLTGTMEKQDFEKILKNLIFPN